MIRTNRDIIIPLILTIIEGIVFWIVSSTLTTAIVFIPGALFAFMLYLKTCYKKLPKPDRIVPLYLLALAIQLLHFTEEYVTDFTSVVPKLLGQEPYPVTYWLVFNMVAYSIFILGGIILYKQIKALMVIPLFFILVGVILNSMAHILIAIYVGGYFSGLYTALLYVVIGPLLLKSVYNETQTISLHNK